MEIEIENFGPIESIRFNLNNELHLIYGDNAIGKSYATYCLYCLIKNIKNKQIASRYMFIEQKKAEHEAAILIRSRLKKVSNGDKLDFTRDYQKLINKELSAVLLEGLQNSLLNTFSSLKNLSNRYSNKNYKITSHINLHERLVILSDAKGSLSLSFQDQIKSIEIYIKSTKSTRFSLYVNGRKEFGCPTEDEFINAFVNYTYSAVNLILRKLDFNIRDIYYLPASRSGLYQALNAFTPIIAELTQNRFFMQNKRIELPSLSEPLADYFIDLSTLDKKHINDEFSSVIKKLQHDILNGDVDYNDKTRQIQYRPAGIDLTLNLSEASSMVAELSPLVLYFRHILNHKYSSTHSRDIFFHDPFYTYGRKNRGMDILFIEEPEAHLHPDVQVKLMEIFTLLARPNLRIFITSHSNYMFNKLNNLLLSKKFSRRKLQVYHMIRTPNGSRVDPDMKVTRDGIDDYNFQSVSEKLYEERIKILEDDSKNSPK